ncbi:hypothetical protein E0W68_02160 [Flavobacterium salilacus subsp. salilacus]|uniref:hypothetical protein n=1 Tax=Flavobacterium TaxID=237 RepID=UPI001074DD31|nr:MULTISPECIES: hypothetical protein [Flavobacterium]KAF2520046.1 hypothetical protein E0W68_02160 [Flavobacterium salilacus subsp. salilacus]MBE1614038.1 hypothetical protein [Flavobacterium sp. SaA2.13]
METKKMIEFFKNNKNAINTYEWDFIGSLVDFFEKKGYLTSKQEYYAHCNLTKVQERLDFLLEEKNKTKEVDGFLLTNDNVTFFEDEDGLTPCYTTRVRHIATGKEYVFQTRKIFDFGHTVNPAYSIAEGIEGGLCYKNKDNTWTWKSFSEDNGWYEVRPIKDLELECYLIAEKHSFSDKEMVM